MVILTFQTLFMARHSGIHRTWRPLRPPLHFWFPSHIISWLVISMYVNPQLLVISWDYLYLLRTPHHLWWFARGCFLWAVRPQAAQPTGNKTRAAGGGEESGI